MSINIINCRKIITHLIMRSTLIQYYRFSIFYVVVKITKIHLHESVLLILVFFFCLKRV